MKYCKNLLHFKPLSLQRDCGWKLFFLDIVFRGFLDIVFRGLIEIKFT